MNDVYSVYTWMGRGGHSMNDEDMGNNMSM